MFVQEVRQQVQARIVDCVGNLSTVTAQIHTDSSLSSFPLSFKTNLAEPQTRAPIFFSVPVGLVQEVNSSLCLPMFFPELITNGLVVLNVERGFMRVLSGKYDNGSREAI